MRRFIAALSILLVAVSGTLFLQWQVGDSAKKVLDQVAPLKEALLAQDAKESARFSESFFAVWEKEKDWMYFVLQHDHIDEAEESAENLRDALSMNTFSTAITALTHIEHTLIYLSEKDQLTLKNLF